MCFFFFGSFTFAAKKTRPSESKRSTASSNANFQLPGEVGKVAEFGWLVGCLLAAGGGVRIYLFLSLLSMVETKKVA